MRHKVFRIIIAVMVFTFLCGTGMVNPETGKTKTDKKDLKKGKLWTHQSVSKSKKEDDLIFDTIKLIEMSIAIFEIKPSDTITKTRSKITVLEGQKCSIQFASGRNKQKIPIDYSIKLKREMIKIFMTPKIIEKKGIEILIETLYTYTKNASGVEKKEKYSPVKSTKTILAKNYEEIIVDLFENKAEEKKIVLKIIPYIKKIPGPGIYPADPKYKLSNAILIMNDELISKKLGNNVPKLVSSSVKKKGKNAADDCFVACIVKRGNKGTFILSVKPFKGSKKIGILDGKILKFRYNKDKFELVSLDPFLPLKGKWIVYGKNIPELTLNKPKGMSFYPYIGKKGGVVILCGEGYKKIISQK